jgi:hypothetical protein
LPSAWVLRDGWKLIHHYEGARDELIRLSEDIGEAHDVVAEHPDIAKSLRSELSAWQREVEAREPSPNPEFERLRRMLPQVANNAFV